MKTNLEDKHIPFEKMMQVLTDIHVADAIALREGEQNNTTEVLTTLYYKAVFAKYKITEAQFYESYTYYQYNAELLDSMYTDIINNISKDQAELLGE